MAPSCLDRHHYFDCDANRIRGEMSIKRSTKSQTTASLLITATLPVAWGIPRGGGSEALILYGLYHKEEQAEYLYDRAHSFSCLPSAYLDKKASTE
jgi:hypothetical protein